MIGVGIDNVEVPRFREVLERTPGLLDRLFTQQEREYGESHADSAPSLAVRFAAKEAAMKAMGVGLGAFEFRDVEVVRGKDGAPELNVVGVAAAIAGELGIESWKVSLSHTCSMATAIVVAE